MYFVYERVVSAAFRALPQVALNARDVDAMQSFFPQKTCSAFVFAVTLSIVLFFFGGVLSWRLRNVCKTVFSRNVLKKYVGEMCLGSVFNDFA